MVKSGRPAALTSDHRQFPIRQISAESDWAFMRVSRLGELRIGDVNFLVKVA